ICLLFFFFFSSRRRHTRFSRDWSSDVCSSDLFIQSPLTTVEVVPRNTVEFEVNGVPVVATSGAGEINPLQVLVPGAYSFSHESRSEERRVGKECRTRWSPDRVITKRSG